MSKSIFPGFEKMKNIKALSFIMVLVSAFLTADYAVMIVEGDDRFSRKFAMAVWGLQFIVWVYMLIKAVKDEKKKSNKEKKNEGE